MRRQLENHEAEQGPDEPIMFAPRQFTKRCFNSGDMGGNSQSLQWRNAHSCVVNTKGISEKQI
jgi:hypothetical protein